MIRRELRQLESSWYSLEKIARSKERLQRTGYFSDVNIETPAVPGTADQVDVNVTVTERNTGTLNFGVGYSQAEKLTLQASVSQANILGTGNHAGLPDEQRQRSNKIYSFTLPESVLDRRRHLARLRHLPARRGHVQPRRWPPTRRTRPASGMRFGIPVTEYDTVNLGFTAERTKLKIEPVRAAALPGVRRTSSAKSPIPCAPTSSFARDTRDSLTWPTRGWLNEIGARGRPAARATSPTTAPPTRASVFWTPERAALPHVPANGELGLRQRLQGQAAAVLQELLRRRRGLACAASRSRPWARRTSTATCSAATGASSATSRCSSRCRATRRGTCAWPRSSDVRQRLGRRRQDPRPSTCAARPGVAVSWDSPVGPLRFSFAYPFKKQPERQDRAVPVPAGQDLLRCRHEEMAGSTGRCWPVFAPSRRRPRS